MHHHRNRHHAALSLLLIATTLALLPLLNACSRAKPTAPAATTVTRITDPAPSATPLPTREPATATPVPTATATPTPTATAIPPTATPTPAPTLTPTPAPTATPAATATPEFAALTVNADVLNVRSGPSAAYPVVGRLQAGIFVRITGKNASGDWWQVESESGQGWVAGNWVTVTGPAQEVIEVAVAPPPTPKLQMAAAAGAPAGGGSFGYGVQAHMVHNDEAPRVMQAVQDLGFSWVKQQVEWRVFESSQGNIDFGALDNIVNQANSAGVSLLFSVVNSPAWARESGFDQNSGGPPADPQTYANFVGRLAGKYCNTSLKAIEVWNEQNMDYEWGRKPLDPAQYMKLLRAAFNSIRSACPSMLVISGALTPTGWNDWIRAADDFEYLERMYQLGLAGLSDGIGVHPSGFNVPPNVRYQDACAAIQRTGNSFNGPCNNPHHSWSALSTMEGVYNIMRTYGDGNKRIWPTEFGWAAGGAFDARYLYANDNSYEEQAAWTVEFFRWMRSTNFVGPAFLWNLNFRVVANGSEKAQWGIVDPGWNPLQVYNALRDARRNGTLP